MFCDDSEDTQHPACPEGKSPPGSVAAQPKAVVHGGTHSAVIHFWLSETLKFLCDSWHLHQLSNSHNLCS